MDSGNDGEKSLPGMSFPKWMRRATERYDYDTCSSPPINPDGFFQLKYRQRPSAGQGTSSETAECPQIQKRRDQSLLIAATSAETNCSGIYSSAGIVSGKIQLQRYVPPSDGESVCSMTPESTNIYKTVSTAVLSNNGGPVKSHTAPSSPAKGHPNTVDAMQISEANRMVRTHSAGQQHFSDDCNMTTSAAVQKNVPLVMITKGDDDGRNFKGLLDAAKLEFKVKTDRISVRDSSVPRDPTPCSTPAVTPASSPQMGRRTGNPFFTPSSNATGSVSWLFRPPQPDVGSSDRERDKSYARDNILYEKKVDVQLNPTTNTVKQSVRYVPRPSKLRELNFWSPTSM